MKMPIEELANDFIDLLYPRICAACGDLLIKQESLICTRCVYEFPRTNFHLLTDNPVSQIFWGRVEIAKATSWFFFKQGSRFRKLIHQLKYKGKKEIGIELGSLFGAELKPSGWLSDINLLIPVPLHEKRLRKRGYNQAEMICNGFSISTGIPVNTAAFIRTRASETQTKKSRFDRWINVETIFQVAQPDEIRNKHLLLMDDVITTGSTLEACIHSLLQTEGVKVSVASLGFASR